MTVDPKGNRARTWHFRDQVVLYLHVLGLSEAHVPKLGDGNPIARGDIEGLPWLLDVHCAKTMDLSGALDKVSTRASFGHRELYAVIHKRKAHPTSQAYVTMPLAVFSKVLTSACQVAPAPPTD